MTEGLLKKVINYVNSKDKEREARSDNATDLMNYTLRNRGKIVEDTNWVICTNGV